MLPTEIFERYPPLKDIQELIRFELLQVCRPPEQTIIKEEQFKQMLDLSKSQAIKIRNQGLITYRKTGNKIYYLLSDILDYLKKYEVPAIDINRLLNHTSVINNGKEKNPKKAIKKVR